MPEKIKEQEPTPTQPPVPAPAEGPQAVKCPGGQTWDPQQQKCVPIPLTHGEPGPKPTEPGGGPFTEAEWDTEWINNLPDESFAVISSGGNKDEQGKTVPRTLRHLPHHNAQGNLDLPHLRNALARLPQTDLSAEEKSEAQKHLCAHAKEAEIESEVCGLTKESYMLERIEKRINEAIQMAISKEALKDPKNLKEYKDLENQLIETRKAKVLLEAELSRCKANTEEAIELEKNLREHVLKELKSIVFERIPSHWGVGPTQMNIRLKHLITDLEGGGQRE